MPCSRRWAVKGAGSRQLVLLQIHGTACARVQEDLLRRRRRKRLLHGGHPTPYDAFTVSLTQLVALGPFGRPR